MSAPDESVFDRAHRLEHDAREAARAAPLARTTDDTLRDVPVLKSIHAVTVSRACNHVASEASTGAHRLEHDAREAARAAPLARGPEDSLRDTLARLDALLVVLLEEIRALRAATAPTGGTP